MRLVVLSGILAVVVAALSIAIACEHDDDADDGYGGAVGVMRDAQRVCGPQAVCARSVECGTHETRAECLAFYSDAGNCADMDGYVECECACLDDEGGCEAFNLCELHCLGTYCQ